MLENVLSFSLSLLYLSLSALLVILSTFLHKAFPIIYKALVEKYNYADTTEFIETEGASVPAYVTANQEAALWNIAGFKQRMAVVKERSNQAKQRQVIADEEEGLIDLQRSLELAKRMNKTGVEAPNE